MSEARCSPSQTSEFRDGRRQSRIHRDPRFVGVMKVTAVSVIGDVADGGRKGGILRITRTRVPLSPKRFRIAGSLVNNH